MNIIISFAIILVSWALAITLDMYFHIKKPPVYWGIGILSGMFSATAFALM